jgi:predicted transposase YdaD
MFALMEKYDVQETRRVEREIGRQEGRQEGALMAAERALRKGADPEDVAFIQDLPLEVVLEIRENMS